MSMTAKKVVYIFQEPLNLLKIGKQSRNEETI